VQLRKQLRTILISQTNAERLRCKRRKKTKKIPAYVVNQYTFTNTLLGTEKSGKLESSQAEVKQYFRKIHSDSLREESLGHCERLTHDIKTFQHLHLSFSTPISKTAQPIHVYRR